VKVQLSLELSEGLFSALRQGPGDFPKEMRLAAAVKWYEMGMVSQEKVARIAGLSRKEFLEPLSRFKVSPFQYDLHELRKNLNEFGF